LISVYVEETYDEVTKRKVAQLELIFHGLQIEEKTLSSQLQLHTTTVRVYDVVKCILKTCTENQTMQLTKYV